MPDDRHLTSNIEKQEDLASRVAEERRGANVTKKEKKNVPVATDADDEYSRWRRWRAALQLEAAEKELMDVPSDAELDPYGRLIHTDNPGDKEEEQKMTLEAGRQVLATLNAEQDLKRKESRLADLCTNWYHNEAMARMANVGWLRRPRVERDEGYQAWIWVGTAAAQQWLGIQAEHARLSDNERWRVRSAEQHGAPDLGSVLLKQATESSQHLDSQLVSRRLEQLGDAQLTCFSSSSARSGLDGRVDEDTLDLMMSVASGRCEVP